MCRDCKAAMIGGLTNMNEVRVIARSVARSGRENRLKELLQGMLAPTRSESGCKLHELYESDSKGRFYFFEVWDSRSALNKHAAGPHFRHLEQTIRELVQEPFEINILKTIPTGAAAARNSKVPKGETRTSKGGSS